jgi:hypothetical protein
MSDFDASAFLNSRNPVLRRLAKELLESEGDAAPGTARAAHSSHSQGSGRGHTSYVSSTMRKTNTEPPKSE